MITVIMPSYLGDYPGSRVNPVPKFIRAVQSFLDQTWKDSELIIVSDGCDLTQEIWHTHFKEESRIKFFRLDRGAGWPGELRQFGINQAAGELITYLDSDDILESTRLERLVNLMQSKPFILDSTYTVPLDSLSNNAFYHKSRDFNYAGLEWTQYRAYSTIQGTCQVCHVKDTKGVSWTTTETRCEDSRFIIDLIKAHPNLGRADFSIPVGGYLVCHSPQFGFDV